MSQVENENIQIEEMNTEEIGNENKEAANVFTEDDLRVAYNEGQKAGYAAAVRQIRTSVNDYLNDLLISIEVNSQKK